MADEISISGAMTYRKTPGRTYSVTETAATFNVTGRKAIQAEQAIGTAAGGEAIGLGDLASLGRAFFKNLDSTNYLEILDAVSGTAILKLKAGEWSLFRFGSGVTAPAAQANTGACNLEYLIVED
jgi:hypothetical protein